METGRTSEPGGPAPFSSLSAKAGQSKAAGKSVQYIIDPAADSQFRPFNRPEKQALFSIDYSTLRECAQAVEDAAFFYFKTACP
jgi:hypothetical protein